MLVSLGLFSSHRIERKKTVFIGNAREDDVYRVVYCSTWQTICQYNIDVDDDVESIIWWNYS